MNASPDDVAALADACTCRQAAILRIVALFPGVLAASLASALADGRIQPPGASDTIRVHVCHLNKRIAPLGWAVRGLPGRAPSGYRLLPLDGARAAVAA